MPIGAYDPQQIASAIQLIQTNGMKVPDNPDEIVEMAQQLSQQAQIGDQLMEEVKNVAQQAQGYGQSMEQSQQVGMGAAASRKVFNLRKAQMMDGPMVDELGTDPRLDMPSQETTENPASPVAQQFQDPGQLKQWLDQVDEQTAKDQLYDHVSGEAGKNALAEFLYRYYETGMTETDKWKEVANFFEVLSGDVAQNELEIPATFSKGGSMNTEIKKIVEETNAAIEKSAKASVSGKKFNLKKYAQHQTLQNTIMWGPGQVRVDPFSRQPISDWHLVERNKGFGLQVGDIWNIDWESIWRNTIMDKYSQPYRDKDGNWVGGYIQKRFEVDKNIPEQNNYQLKPGQKRKPRLPEYGSMESRMQAKRAEEEKDLAPFDWTEDDQKNPEVKVASETTKEADDKEARTKHNPSSYGGTDPLTPVKDHHNAEDMDGSVESWFGAKQEVAEEYEKQHGKKSETGVNLVLSCSKKKKRAEAQIKPFSPIEPIQPLSEDPMHPKKKYVPKETIKKCQGCGNILPKGQTRCSSCGYDNAHPIDTSTVKLGPDPQGQQSGDTFIRQLDVLAARKEKPNHIKVETPKIKETFMSDEFKQMADPSDDDEVNETSPSPKDDYINKIRRQIAVQNACDFLCLEDV